MGHSHVLATKQQMKQWWIIKEPKDTWKEMNEGFVCPMHQPSRCPWKWQSEQVSLAADQWTAMGQWSCVFSCWMELLGETILPDLPPHTYTSIMVKSARMKTPEIWQDSLLHTVLNPEMVFMNGYEGFTLTLLCRGNVTWLLRVAVEFSICKAAR